MKRLLIVLALVLSLSLALAAACGGATPAPATTVTVTATKTATPTPTPTPTPSPTPTPTATPTPTPVKLDKVVSAEAAGGSQVFFWKVGLEQGAYQKRGIAVEVKEMAADAAKVAIFVGTSDTGTGDPFAYYQERKDVRIVGPLMSGHQSIVVRKDSPYKSYQDLKGKKVAMLGPATGQYQWVKALVKMQGLDLEKDFQLTIGAPPVQIGWLLKGEVEAITIYEPFVSKLLVSDGDKVRELYWLNDLTQQVMGSSWLYGGLLTSEKWAKENADVAKRLGLGHGDAYTYIATHPEVWKSDSAKKIFQVDDPAVLELLAKRMPATAMVPPYGPQYKAAIVKRTEAMVGAGLLPPETVDWVKAIVLFAD